MLFVGAVIEHDGLDLSRLFRLLVRTLVPLGGLPTMLEFELVEFWATGDVLSGVCFPAVPLLPAVPITIESELRAEGLAS